MGKIKKLIALETVALSVILAGLPAYAKNDQVQSPSFSLNQDMGSFSGNIDMGSFSNMDLGSMDMGNMSLGSNSGTGSESLNFGSTTSGSLDTGSLSSGSSLSFDSMNLSTDSFNMAGSTSGTDQSQNAGSGVSQQATGDQSQLKAQTPSLDDINLNLGSLDLESMANFPKSESFQMQDFQSLQAELTESMKQNASTTLSSLMGDSFKGLDTNLFGNSNMPSNTDFERLNVEYASLMSELENKGFGKEFSGGTLPSVPSTTDTINGLNNTLSGLADNSGQKAYESAKNALDNKAVDVTENVKNPIENKAVTTHDANSLFASSFKDAPTGVSEKSIPSGFGSEASLLQEASKIRAQALEGYTGSGGYEQYKEKLGLAVQDSNKKPSIDNGLVSNMSTTADSLSSTSKGQYETLKAQMQAGN